MDSVWYVFFYNLTQTLTDPLSQFFIDGDKIVHSEVFQDFSPSALKIKGMSVSETQNDSYYFPSKRPTPETSTAYSPDVNHSSNFTSSDHQAFTYIRGGK